MLSGFRQVKFSATLLLVFLLPLLGFALAGAEPQKGGNDSVKERPYFEYQGNYGFQVEELKNKFKADFGYDLVDEDQFWRLEEIERMQAIFSKLPPAFYRLSGLKGLYRNGHLQSPRGAEPLDDVPAAAFPKFSTIYRNSHKAYIVRVQDEPFRVEFYNPIFYESEADFENIVHHEMAHAYDIANGFLTFKKEWLAVSNFRIINWPALDAKKNSDFVFALMDDSKARNYAPVSQRHHPTYSRQNPQEDFANSVAAYMHYPYFKYSHSRRYAFLNEKVFKGKEFFPKNEKSDDYKQIVLSDAVEALKGKDWERLIKIVTESSRNFYPELDAELIKKISRAAKTEASKIGLAKLGIATCYLYAPSAFELRVKLIKEKRTTVRDLLKSERCFIMGKTLFERELVKWSMDPVTFYREENSSYLKFIDRALLTAYARGFVTTYRWTLVHSDSKGTPIAQGIAGPFEQITGSIKIELEKTAGKKLNIPLETTLELYLETHRIHPKTHKRFVSSKSRTRFVVYPWFNYIGPGEPSILIR